MRVFWLLKLTWKAYSLFHGLESPAWLSFMVPRAQEKLIEMSVITPAVLGRQNTDCRQGRHRNWNHYKLSSLPWASDPNWILSLLNVKPAISTGCITEMGSRCAFSFKEFMACRSLLVKFHTGLHILTNSSFTTLASKKSYLYSYLHFWFCSNSRSI